MTDPQSTVILHLTDLHFGWEGGQNQQTLRNNRTNCLNALHAALQKLIADPTNENWKPNIVAITGDLTMRARHREFAAACKWIRALDVPVTVEVGNHDLPYFNPIERFFDPLPFWYAPFEGTMIDERAYPMHAITQRPMAMYHSWGSQNAWLRQIHGANRLFMARSRGEALGIADDDWVWISSQIEIGRAHV